MRRNPEDGVLAGSSNEPLQQLPNLITDSSFHSLAKMTSQMVKIHTPDLKWWLAHLESDFHAVDLIDLFVKCLIFLP
jgi:chemotaxis protein CheY-P-specific phosphatase CheC